MIEAVTQETLHTILPFKVSQVVMLYVKQCGVSEREALKTIYSSKMYEDLEVEKTKLWHLGPVALLEILMEELDNKD